MEFVKVTQVEDPRVLTLLALAAGDPSAGNLVTVCLAYGAGAASRMFALVEDDVVLGVIGVEPAGERAARVRHLAVAESVRRQGLGRRLLDNASEAFGVTRLVAETDGDGVGFYLACGFTVRSLGNKFPGVERFWCLRDR